MRDTQEFHQKDYFPAHASGIAPATTQSTAATDNLAAVMKNAVVFLKPSFRVIGPPRPQKDSGPVSGNNRGNTE